MILAQVKRDKLRESLPHRGRVFGAVHIPTNEEINASLTPEQQRLGEIADDYFLRMDFYPHIAYRNIGKRAVWICLNQTGSEHLWPSTAFACLEQETGGKMLFGADWGSIRVDRVPFCHLFTTDVRVNALVSHVRNGGWSNGVGLGQVTYGPYVIEMERLGGGHKPHVQMYKSFNVLNDLLNMWPYLEALEAYNDGSKWNNPNNPYDKEFAAKHTAWKARLA
jgi:hypothetical protein